MVQQNPDTRSFPAAPNRRAVLAFIALANLPVPIMVDFFDEKSISLKVETVVEVDGWVGLLGIEAPHFTVGNGDRDIYSTGQHHFNGWYITVTAYIPKGQRDGLDVETGTQLQQLLDPPGGAA